MRIRTLILLCILAGCTEDPIMPSASYATVAFTRSVTNVNSTGATSGGSVSSNGGAVIIERGICWSMVSSPSTSDNKIVVTGGLGDYTADITGLNPGVTFYIRAFVTNSIGTSYGNTVSFTTLNVPALTTTSLSSITSTSAISGGNVTSSGGSPVTAKGVCWNTSTSPTIALSTKTNNGTGTGSYSSSVTGLSLGTTYYVRAYATNSVGTSYGNELSFTTLNLPTVATNAITSITTTSAVSGGNVSSDGGSAVTSRGVCWSTLTNPTTALSTKTVNGSGTGSFSSSITGLTTHTTYYVRAYATNSVGTSYGSNVSFTTN